MLADRLVIPEYQIPHCRLGLWARRSRVKYDPTLAGVVIDGDHLVWADLVAAGIEPRGWIEAE